MRQQYWLKVQVTYSKLTAVLLRRLSGLWPQIGPPRGVYRHRNLWKGAKCDARDKFSPTEMITPSRNWILVTISKEKGWNRRKARMDRN